MKTEALNLDHVGVSQFTDHNITDSSDWRSIIEIAMKHDGMLVLGRAGTGKSHVIQRNQ
jgi:DNA replication protein DnaC